jgi:hypothetical protein
MFKSHRLTVFVVGLGVFQFSQAQLINRLLDPEFKVVLGAKQVEVDEPWPLTVERVGSRERPCSIEVSWGDGEKRKYRVEVDKPLVASHAYRASGAYPVIIEGTHMMRGLSSTLGCRGDNVSTAVVVRGEGAAPIARGAASSDRNIAQQVAPATTLVAVVPEIAAATPQVVLPDAGSAYMLGDEAKGKRVAYLVGNAHYQSGMAPLINPPQDVKLIQGTLQNLGFDVIVASDASQRSFQSNMRDFARRAQGAQVAFFYYSGHGIQSGGENYLLPVDAVVDKEADLDIEAVPLGSVLRQLEDAGPRYTIVALDACRDNPIAKRQKSGLIGLARVDKQPTSSFIAYATQAGRTATDDGIFARSMSKRLSQPGLGLRAVFDLIAMDVDQYTQRKQQPLRLDGLRNDVYLAGRVASAVTPEQLPAACSSQQGDALQACMRWQCMSDAALAHASSCQAYR